MEWKYKDKVLPNKTPSSFGFVYQITFEDDSLYIGKKQMFALTTIVAKKDESKRDGHQYFANKIKNHKIVKHEVIKKENSWRSYSGSSKSTKHLKIKKKEVLEFCVDKLNLTYCEIKWMFALDVLRSKLYHNDNIFNRFFLWQYHTRIYWTVDESSLYEGKNKRTLWEAFCQFNVRGHCTYALSLWNDGNWCITCY